MTIGLWVVLGALAVAIEVAAWRGAGAGLERLVGAAARPPAGRVLLLLGWLWVGWHFFGR